MSVFCLRDSYFTFVRPDHFVLSISVGSSFRVMKQIVFDSVSKGTDKQVAISQNQLINALLHLMSLLYTQ